MATNQQNEPVCQALNATWPVVPYAAFETAVFLNQTVFDGTLCDVWYLGTYDGVDYNTTSMSVSDGLCSAFLSHYVIVRPD